MTVVNPPEDAPPTEGPTLVSRAVAGDRDAFAALYDSVHPRLLRYAASLVGRDAEDVAAEAWLHIVRDLPKFEGDDAAFRAWAARILRNRAMDHVRLRARRPVELTDVDDVLDSPDRDDTETTALTELSTQDAIALISSLPREQAEAVLLRFVLDLDGPRAAEIVGKNAGTIRVATHRGLKRLAKLMEGDR